MKTVVDQMGRKVQMPNNPKRIISIVPSQTELLHYWGLGERVVGITKFCLHPEEWFRNKNRIGGTKTLNFDKIRSLKPDLIIGNKEENTQSEIELLEQEYPVWMSDMHNLEEVWQMMFGLGSVLGVQEQSNLLVSKLKSDFEGLKSSSAVDKKLKVAYLIWKDPYMVAASNTFIHEMLEQSGFENAFQHLSRYPEVTLETLAQMDLDAVFLSTEPFPFKEKHQLAFQQIYPHAQIEIVDGELFSWYGSRLLHATDYIKKLKEKLYS